MTDRLIRITTALAVVAVAVVAAVISYQHAFELVRSHGESGDGAAGAVHGGRADLGRLHGGAGRQPQGPAGTTAGRLEPGHRDRGHGRRQPGTRRRPRPGRRAGQRVARTGAGRLVRTADDAIRTGRGTRTGDTGPDLSTSLHHRWRKKHHWNCRLRQPWSTPSAPGTERAAASAPSPANSTSTAARSNASSTKRYDSVDGPGAQAQYASLQYRSRPSLSADLGGIRPV